MTSEGFTIYVRPNPTGRPSYLNWRRHAVDVADEKVARVANLAHGYSVGDRATALEMCTTLNPGGCMRAADLIDKIVVVDLAQVYEAVLPVEVDGRTVVLGATRGVLA